MTGDPQGRLSYFEAALTNTVRAVQSSGNEVLLVQTIPHFEEPEARFDPLHCSISTVVDGSCWPRRSLAQVEGLQGAVRKAIWRVARDTGAEVADFRGILCDARNCYTRRNGRILYLDGHHLSVAASESFANVWASILDASSTEESVGPRVPGESG
jgi:hypothetical protein